MTGAETLGLVIAGCLAVAAGLATWSLVDLTHDLQRAAQRAWQRRPRRAPRLLALLRVQRTDAPPVEFSLAELYGLAGVPWRSLSALGMVLGIGLLLPLVLELGFWPLLLIGLLGGLIPVVIRRMLISNAQARILDQVRDFLLALRLRLVLHVSLTAALREIAESPAEVARLGVLGRRLHHHVTSAEYDRSPEELLARLAGDLRSRELRTLCRRAQSVGHSNRSYAEALQESMGEVSQEILTRREQDIEGTPSKLILVAGSTLFALLLVLFALPILARALATITGVPGFYVP